MIKSFQTYFGLTEDAATDLVTLNTQEAVAMKKVDDAQKELDAIRLKIADTNRIAGEEAKKKAQADQAAAAMAPIS